MTPSADLTNDIEYDEREHILSIHERPHVAAGSSSSYRVSWVFGLVALLVFVVGFVMGYGGPPLSRSIKSLIIPRRNDLFIPPSALILIQTGPENFEGRVKEIRETWGMRVHEKTRLKLVFVTTSMQATPEDVWVTGCQDGYLKASCKLAHALEKADAYLRTDGSLFDWVFYADDDIYLLPDNMQHLIVGLGPDAATNDGVYGLPGCVDKCVGFCGGAGFLISKTSLEKIITGRNVTRYPSLAEEMAKINDKCGDFHDVAFGYLVEKVRNMTMIPYPIEPHVWFFDNETKYTETYFKKTPFSWMYHYPSRDHMYAIHNATAVLGTNMKIHQDEI